MATIYVDANAGGTVHNGTSWASAYLDLQQAFSASVSGDQIRVADGTYRPTKTASRSISFVLKNGVQVLGGYAGDGAPNPDLRDLSVASASILSGDIGTAGDVSDNSFHVLTAASSVTSTTLLDGFYITGGNANGQGGGMLNQGSPTIRNCTFARNSSTGNGGAMYTSIGTPSLINCVFSGNTAASGGGGIYCLDRGATLTNCTFSGNSAPSAPAIHATTVQVTNPVTWTNCVIWGNVSFIRSRFSIPIAITARNCDFENFTPFATNRSVDPLFVDAGGADDIPGTPDDDLRLRSCSPLVDAGDNTAALLSGITTDRAGLPRFIDVPTTPNTGPGTPPIVDVGAYETMPGLDLEASGFYRVIVGQAVTLLAQGASDHPGALNYAWDFDADGQFDDATGASPAFPSAGIPAGTVRNVSVRMTDGLARTRVDQCLVKVVPQVMRVDSTASGSSNGATWVDAYPNLSAALADAVAGNEIKMAQGVYTPTSGTDRFATFALKSGITVRGGYAGASHANPDVRDITAYPTVLSGDIGATGDRSDNSYTVLTAISALSVVLDGVTVTGGNANHTSLRHGAGLYCSAGDPTILNTVFRDNSATTDAGAIYFSVSRPVVTGCTFLRNSSGNFGGAVNIVGDPFDDVSIWTNCVFAGNTALSGGAVKVQYNTRFFGCVFVGNRATIGGAMYASSGGLTVVNCTIASNQATSATGTGGIYMDGALYNSILWGNAGDEQLSGGFARLQFSHSNIQGGAPTGSNMQNLGGIINADPQFLQNPSRGPDNQWGTHDDDYGDLRPRLAANGSPCIDSAAGYFPAGGPTDLAGNPREVDVPGVAGVTVDMGAYEYAVPLSAATSRFEFDLAPQSVQFSFNGDLAPTSLAGADLELFNVTTGTTADTSGFAAAYNVATRTAQWRFAGSLTDGNYRASLAAGTLADPVGNPLTGVAQVDFFVLAGDANRDRTVNINDFSILASRFNLPGVFSQGDFNYDGVTNISDFAILASKFNTSLPAARTSATMAMVPVANERYSPVQPLDLDELR